MRRPQIKDIGAAKRTIDAKAVAKALEAEEQPGFEIRGVQGPASIMALRQFIAMRLRSTGGRPKMEGTRSKCSKVPLFEEDVEKLKELQTYYRNEKGIKISIGQLASTLVHLQISELFKQDRVCKVARRST